MTTERRDGELRRGRRRQRRIADELVCFSACLVGFRPVGPTADCSVVVHDRSSKVAKSGVGQSAQIVTARRSVPDRNVRVLLSDVSCQVDDRLFKLPGLEARCAPRSVRFRVVGLQAYRKFGVLQRFGEHAEFKQHPDPLLVGRAVFRLEANHCVETFMCVAPFSRLDVLRGGDQQLGRFHSTGRSLGSFFDIDLGVPILIPFAVRGIGFAGSDVVGEGQKRIIGSERRNAPMDVQLSTVNDLCVSSPHKVGQRPTKDPPYCGAKPIGPGGFLFIPQPRAQCQGIPPKGRSKVSQGTDLVAASVEPIVVCQGVIRVENAHSEECGRQVRYELMVWVVLADSS